MNIIDILQRDHNVNHKDSKHFFVSVEEILSKMTQGYKLTKFDKTVIIYKPVGSLGDGVEFHCYNAGTANELALTVLEFFKNCKEQGADWTITPYQNPRINELFAAHIPASQLSIVETATGFEATTRL